MNSTIKLTDHIYYLGVNDRRTHFFENYWPLPRGVAYNSYLIKDVKTALIDTIEISKVDEYLDRIREILGSDGKPDYLIINHMEPDHSGAIRRIMNSFPDIQLVGNKHTMKLLEGFYGITKNFILIHEAEELDLGNHKLRFYMVPMLHWPETMVTYEERNKVLFSADAFGSFGTLDGGIFDDEIDLSYYEDEIRRYYSNIVAKYASPVQKALQKLAPLPIEMIASTHGPVWRSSIDYIIKKYDQWSKFKTEKGVVIVFGSMYGHTEAMAEVIARALAEDGIQNIRMFDASKTHASYILNDIFKYNGLIMGSPAYNGTIFPPMEHLVSKLENIGLKNHLLGIFGSSSWGGGGVKALSAFAEKSGMELVAEPIEARCAAKEAEIDHCKTIGKNMAKRLHQIFPG